MSLFDVFKESRYDLDITDVAASREQVRSSLLDLVVQTRSVGEPGSRVSQLAAKAIFYDSNTDDKILEKAERIYRTVQAMSRQDPPPEVTEFVQILAMEEREIGLMSELLARQNWGQAIGQILIASYPETLGAFPVISPSEVA